MKNETDLVSPRGVVGSDGAFSAGFSTGFSAGVSTGSLRAFSVLSADLSDLSDFSVREVKKPDAFVFQEGECAHWFRALRLFLNRFRRFFAQQSQQLCGKLRA